VTGFPKAEVSELPFSGLPEADRLLVEDPMALLIGFVLDQQVQLQRAFSAPFDLRTRLGSIAPADLLVTDREKLIAAFVGPPALHRFPRMMAERVLELCRVVEERFDRDPTRIWEEAQDAVQLRARLRELPGIGPMKATVMMVVLGKQLGVRPKGWRQLLPDHPTLGDVRDSDGLFAYQTQKRAQKKAARTAAGG
jgi:uncharacterized HhH-GPD family protein